MITQTQPGTPPGQSAKPKRPGQEEEEERKPTPQETSLLRQQEQINKRLERIQKQKQAGNVIRSFLKIAQPNPNDNPMGLYAQISPTLNKLGLEATKIERNKTELVIGKTNAQKDNMYKILLRRTAEITGSTAADINRNTKSFESIIWTAKGMEAYVWGPYAPPAEEGVPEGEEPGVV